MSESQFFDGPPTALEVRRYEFDAALRGYDRGQVDAFREVLADELERLARVVQARDEELRLLRNDHGAVQAHAELLRAQLATAQRSPMEVTEQAIGDAQREAQRIVRDARAEADRLLESVRSERQRVQAEVHALWHARRSELTRLRHSLERQLVEISIAEAEPVPNVMSGSSGGGA